MGCLGGIKKVPKTIHLLTFMIPTFGIYLANPILSLVDTATVGQFCDSVELASLGPGCALCDMVVYLANFLAVATTSLLAGALAKNDIVAARRHVSCAFSISLAMGTAMAGMLFFFGEFLVGLFAGDGEAAKKTLSRSLAYVRIRGAGSAPTLLAMVAQAACIGAKDADSPLRAIAVVSIFNVFLDWLFVGPFKKGVAGAAWATTIAQTAGAIYLYWSVQATIEKLESERTYDGGDILFNKKDDDGQHQKRSRSLLVVPTVQEILKFFQFAGPMFIISLCRGVSWNITTPAAAVCGTIALAAHQVVLNVFFFFTIAGEAVFQTAQAFMPEFQQQQEFSKATGDKELIKEANERVQKLAKKILIIASIIGGIQAAISAVPAYLLPGGFTSDKSVQKVVRDMSGLLALSIFPHCATIAIEALLLNSKDIEFLGQAHVVTCIAWAMFLKWQAKNWPGLSNMWKGMMYLQYIRAFIWCLRLVFSGKKLGIHTYSTKVYRRRHQKSAPAP